MNDIAVALGYGLSRYALSPDAARVLTFGASAVLGIVFVALLARALLRDQLFDFDLKLRLNVKRGTIVAVFLAAFFVASAIAEQYLQQYGYVVGGVLVGLLLFAIRPIERTAERFASAAVPGAVDSPEYRLVKKREVYRAAIEGALEDGDVTDKERSVLARLADQLGLSATETLDVEREARASASATRRASNPCKHVLTKDGP